MRAGQAYDRQVAEQRDELAVDVVRDPAFEVAPGRRLDSSEPVVVLELTAQGTTIRFSWEREVALGLADLIRQAAT